MLFDFQKLVKKETAIGRFEYLKIIWGLGLLPILIWYLLIILPPNNIFIYPVAIIALIVILPYIIIYYIATYKRFNNIFNNSILSKIIFLIYFFSFKLRIFRILFNIVLILIPGKKNTENIISKKLFWVSFPIGLMLLIFSGYSGFNRYITTNSMLNTLQKNDRITINIFDTLYNRGDIIIFNTNTLYKRKGIIAIKPNEAIVKRIIGLPGEKIEIKELKDGSSNIYINGKLLNEPYIKDAYNNPPLSSMPYSSIIVPKDSYYVIGDNRGNSYDSRFYGAINKTDIKGKVSHIWYPLNRRKVLLTPEY